MCGIIAISRSSPTAIANLKLFGVAAARAIESRGPHATGFAWPDDLGDPWYWKMPGTAKDVAHLLPLPNRRRSLLVHTRYATHGDPKINDNNHPVVAPGLTLIHNGVVTNYKDILNLLNIKAETEVDSEALAWLLAYGPGQLDAEPWELLELVEGRAAVAWIDADEPHVLHLARLAGSPMVIGWTRCGDLVMASTQWALRDLEKRTGVRFVGIKTVPEGTYMRVEGGNITFSQRFAVPRTPFLPAPPPPPKAKAKAPKVPAKRNEQLVLPVGHDDLTQRLNPHRRSWAEDLRNWEWRNP